MKERIVNAFESENRSLGKHFLIRGIPFLFAVGLVYFLRPLFHPIIYRVAYSPGMMILVGLTVVAGTILWFLPPLKPGDSYRSKPSPIKKSYALAGVLVLALVLAVAVGAVAGMYEQRTMAENTMDNVEIVDEPPETNEENPRVAPRAVSDTQTDGTLSYPQHTLGDSDIARAEDGTLVWSYPIMPDQIRNQFGDQQIGLVHADMTEMESRNLETYDEHEFEYGQNMRLWNNVEWQMKKQGGYWSAYYDDPYEFIHDGDAYMVYPKTGHEWHLTPVPHTTPTWDGVALVHQDGTIEHLSAEEAQERPELDGQRLYPLHNSKQYSESLEYREGIANQLPLIGEYRNVVEPADMPSGVGNDQPFVVDMEGERMNYVYAMEPPGGGAGLSEIWYFDAETGEPRAYETGGDNVFGPDRAVGIAQGTDTQTEWGEDGEAMAVEPILMTVDGDLYWHIKVTTSDQTDVVRNIFINAEGGAGDDPDEQTDRAVVMDSSSEVEEFIQGEIDEDDLETGEEANIDVEDADETSDDDDATVDDDAPDGVAYYIVITDDDGNEIDRIPVEEGEDPSINIEDAEELPDEDDEDGDGTGDDSDD